MSEDTDTTIAFAVAVAKALGISQQAPIAAEMLNSLALALEYAAIQIESGELVTLADAGRYADLAIEMRALGRPADADQDA